MQFISALYATDVHPALSMSIYILSNNWNKTPSQPFSQPHSFHQDQYYMGGRQQKCALFLFPYAPAPFFFPFWNQPITALHFQVAKHMLWPQETWTAQNVHIHLYVYDNTFLVSVHLKPTSCSPWDITSKTIWCTTVNEQSCYKGD